MRVVLDTNVLVSGLAYPKGVPGRLVAAWDAHRLQVVMAPYQLEEIARVLHYPKIHKLLKWDAEQVEAFLRQLRARVDVVDITGVSAPVPRDAADSPILASLIAARADRLVTGDSDLLTLRERYPIETPAEFLSQIDG